MRPQNGTHSCIACKVSMIGRPPPTYKILRAHDALRWFCWRCAQALVTKKEES